MAISWEGEGRRPPVGGFAYLGVPTQCSLESQFNRIALFYCAGIELHG